jgi:hypothetical protein
MKKKVRKTDTVPDFSIWTSKSYITLHSSIAFKDRVELCGN